MKDERKQRVLGVVVASVALIGSMAWAGAVYGESRMPCDYSGDVWLLELEELSIDKEVQEDLGAYQDLNFRLIERTNMSGVEVLVRGSGGYEEMMFYPEDRVW